MKTGKELRLLLGQAIRAHRHGDSKLQAKLQEGFVQKLGALKKADLAAGQRVESIYIK